ncbi:MAG: ATP-binding protein [Spongiibacteraceae bacterium]
MEVKHDRNALRAAAQNDYLLSLRKTASRVMHDAVLYGNDLPDVYRLLTQNAAKALNIARVGIWLFSDDDEQLICANLYDARDTLHHSAMQLACADYPAYVSAISSDQLVVVNDTHRDAVTAELVENYLKPLNIVSMLDAPIVRDGRTIGVLCHEHIGAQRQWEAGELAFAETLSDFITLSIESFERRKIEAEKLRLASIVESTSDLVATVDPSGKPLYLNSAGRELLGLPLSQRIEDFNVRDIYSDEYWQQREQIVIPHALAHGCWNGETEILTLSGEKIPVAQSIIVHRDKSGAVLYISSIMRDLREQKRIEQELRQLNSELEQRVAERTKQLESVNQNLETFAFSVSHDLKAPLRGIDGYSKLLLDEYRTRLPEEAQLFIDNIRMATEQMQQLIDDLLAYSRVGRRELTVTNFSLRQIIDRILFEQSHDITAGAIVVDDRITDLELHTDLDCLMQILRNLIDNAIKFSRQSSDPKIELSSSVNDRTIVIRVKDNGCGFDMKYHDRIFNIFQRLHRADQYPGTGVGLAIVVKAAERIGGRVWATSEPGKGAEFFLEFPYGK